MLCAVALALLWPAIGTSDGPLHLGLVTNLGVSLVFFLHGAALSRQSLKAGVSNWRLHAFVQSTTYLVFPLIGIVLVLAIRGALPPDLVLGVFYLCALPSTISSSVAMTSLGKGNVPGAIFNASLSNIVGMAATPLLIGIMVSTGGAHLPLGKAVLDIALQLLLPFVLGQLLRPWLADWLARNKPVISKLDRGVVVLIVYSSFCDSTAAGLWHNYAWWMLAVVFVLVGILLAVVLLGTTWISRSLGFSLPDEVAAVFCGSKKSLATGIPMAKLLFAGHPGLGLIVLPVMFYHQLQLLVCSVLARRYAERAA
ncbi:solute carrier family 10 (sodium/bile acid cotransporter), member 7 [Andreprevotia lacus DSM 23236]|uniref:Solute carrier family 10 (Sodium/bile acid cotransporter), member 7 n=2 Tax=Andreprevotia TaxID=397275 RepID=A0A1W1XUC7_9NEIS|nr:solute carrier family 10 (sodium/bile acid cotransporter), member 7 [Andreprevotia lacus DSM 23236]